jgi:hypothetical protein
MSEDIYARLAKHLSSLGMGYPEKEELLEILKENFTPVEAEIALSIPTKVIPLQPTSIDEIARNLVLERKDLEGILARLADRGLLFSGKMKDGNKGYDEGASLCACRALPSS